MKKILPFILALLVLSAPLTAFAQFGPIVPDVCRTCACGFGGVMAIIQNVINFIIAISIVIATLIMVWAGVLYILSPTNPESRSTANKMLINAALGIVIVLSAWLIVDFVMKTLYNNNSKFGPWNTILISGTGDSCVVAKEPKPLFSGNILAVPGQGSGAGGGTGGGFTGDVTSEPLEGNDGSFTYDPGIQAQTRHASFRLAATLVCMSQRVPANVGRISSISDSQIIGGKTFAQCAAGGCNHSVGSCHYGGRGSCVGQSYAVDFGDGNPGSTALAQLSAAARACGADFINPEATHLHVSVGKSCDCN